MHGARSSLLRLIPLAMVCLPHTVLLAQSPQADTIEHLVFTGTATCTDSFCSDFGSGPVTGTYSLDVTSQKIVGAWSFSTPFGKLSSADAGALAYLVDRFGDINPGFQLSTSKSIEFIQFYFPGTDTGELGALDPNIGSDACINIPGGENGELACDPDYSVKGSTALAVTSLEIATTSLPAVTSGQPYNATLAASGGSGHGYKWSLSSGELPEGFTLSSAGVLNATGSPAAPANTYSFTVQVTDSASHTATQPLDLNVLAPSPPAPSGFSAVDLGTLGGAGTTAYGINDRGQVVGKSQVASGAYHAFLYNGGKMIDLGTLPGETESVAYGINNSGQIAGFSGNDLTCAGLQFCPEPSPPAYAFLLSKGSMVSLLSAVPGVDASYAYGINDSGQVVGFEYNYSVPGTSPDFPFLYTAGSVVDLGALPGATATDPSAYAYSYATGINDIGQVTGNSLGVNWEHAFLYSGGSMADLGTLPGGGASGAYGINNDGQVVGYSYVSGLSTEHAFVYSGGVMIDLGTLPGNSSSLGVGVNDAGQVVGAGDEHAFLSTGGVMVDLNDLVTLPGGVALTVGTATNNLGQITASGSNGHAYLLTADKATPDVKLTASENSAVYGTSVAFTANLTGSGAKPTGIVTFLDGTTQLGTASLDSEGVATLATSRLPAGINTVTVSYTGDVSYDAVVSGAVSVTVRKAVLTVTAKNLTKVYGKAVPALTYIVSGFVNGDTSAASVRGAPMLTVAATARSHAGSYRIAVSIGTLAAVNYTFDFVPGTLLVSKAPLTLTAASATVAYGKPLPKLSYTIAGFVNGDTATVLRGAPMETTTAKKGSLPGAYPITIVQGTLTALDYTFAFKKGTLTITLAGPAATPAISPAGGNYSAAQEVRISDATPGATIHYTTDGATPITASPVYTAPIAVSSSQTVKAIAEAPGYLKSAVAMATYKIQ
jgi:probable HAF family extracellular repeat protein